MLTINEIKDRLLETDCLEYMYDGLSYSDPIPTMGKEGIIDNFFLYQRNFDNTLITSPVFSFGVYSETRKTAYIRVFEMEGYIYTRNNYLDKKIITEEYVNEYESLFFKMRQFAFCDIEEEQKKDLKNYITHLKNISGNGMWENYRIIAPSFFMWADNVLI